MNSASNVFLALAVIGQLMLVIGIYLLVGSAWAAIAVGVASLISAAFLKSGMAEAIHEAP
jgi:hypothetical protein